MNTKQEMFVNEYLIDYNATQAAIRAGYSEKTARSIGQQLLTKLDIKNAIKEQREKIQNDNIATAKDVEEFLSLAMNDEIEEEQVLMSPNGEVCRVVKKLSGKDRIKAAELMGKRHALFTDKTEMTVTEVPVFVDDLGDPDG